MMFDLSNLAFIVPEVFLSLSVLLLLVTGVYGGNRMTPAVLFGAVLAVIVAVTLLIARPSETFSIFNGMMQGDGFTHLSKILLLLGAGLVLILSADWLKGAEQQIFEYPVLILLSVLGMMVMVSAGSLLTLYMGLELTSLPLYVLASIRRDMLRSTEAGLKYFVLGSLASGMMLFGMSLIYGFSGTLGFETLTQIFGETVRMAEANNAPMAISGGLLVGLLLVMVGLCFKISAVPFHMWTPDVYEGAPTPVTAFFAVAPKIAALCIFARLLMQPFGELLEYWQQIIVFVSMASMIVGALGAMMQSNIKRLLAYSSIGHVGYALVGIASGSIAGLESLLIYLALYLFMSAGAFGCVLLMRRKGEYVEQISELSGLSAERPLLAATIALFMFSMAGIPPLAGFFGKFYVLRAALESGLYALAIVGVVSSVVAAFYYIKIVKLMYFDEAKQPFDQETSASMRLVIATCSAVTLLFFLYPSPLLQYVKSSTLSVTPEKQAQVSLTR